MPKNNRPGPRPAQSAQAAKQFAPVAAALVCGLAATFILLLIFSWLFTKTQIPAWWAVPLATAAVCVGCFVSAHVLAKKIKKNGLFCGLCAGAFFFVIYLAAALLNGHFGRRKAAAHAPRKMKTTQRKERLFLGPCGPAAFKREA